MRKAVNLILRNDLGQILAVSRKENIQHFGLIGGKMDPEDEDEQAAVIRECKEETGLDIYNVKQIDVRNYGENAETLYEQYCFVADWKGDIYSRDFLDAQGETGLVEWKSASELTKGFFGEYNRWMFELLNIS